MDERIIKELKAIGYMISPKVAYEGDVVFSDESNGDIFFDYSPDYDILRLNSITKNGKNLYDEFVRKYFFNQIGVDVSFIESALIPKIIVGYDKERKNRRPYFTYMFSLVRLIEDIDIVAGTGIESEEALTVIAREHLREVIKKLSDVENNWKASSYFDEIRARVEANGLPMIKESVCYIKESLKKVLVVIRGIKAAIERKPFNNDAFLDCFDYEKLCLIYGKSVLELSRSYEKSTGQIANSLSEVLSYITLIIRSDMKDYNPKIKYFDKKTGRVEKFSFEDLKAGVSELLDRHPEFKVVEVDMATIDKHNLGNDPDKLEDFVHKYAGIIEGEGLSVNWEVIRKGEKDSSNIEPRKRVIDRPYTKKEKNAYEELRRKLTTFSGTDYVLQIVGREKFRGYVGFIYKNGLVAFEKFYDEKNPSLPNMGSHATYIMTIENFVSFSKLSKSEIIEYIKNTDNPDVKRIYHTKTWEDRLLSALSGREYDEETEQIIDALIASGKLSDDRKKVDGK